MSLEAATYISQFVQSNPTAVDPKAQGDDHLRLIKTVLKTTFPNANKAFKFPNSTAAQTSTYAVGATEDGSIIPMNARAAAREVDLPADPGLDGATIKVIKADHSFNPVTIDGNGNTINGESSVVLYQRYQSVTLVWSEATEEWFATYDRVPHIGSMMIWSGASAPSGFIFAAGTIGNAGSGATNRANEDCLGLFQHFYQLSNDICPVSGGRGASAIADFDAGKTITVLDARGRAIFGKDDMISAASRLTDEGTGNSGTAGDVLGSSGGIQAELFELTDLPTTSLALTIDDNGNHLHAFAGEFGVGDGSLGGSGDLLLRGPLTTRFTNAGGSHSHTGTVKMNNTAGQDYFSKIPPHLVQNICWKL